jgi:ABC-type nickel/cobalt efflux system permease component RcnA
MFTVLGLGFLLGLQHAMEADHVAAVAALAAGGKRWRQAVGHGLFWGLGHALSLGAFAALVVMARGDIPDGLRLSLELAVAVMLIALGLMVVWRVLRERLHFHLHRHAGGEVHFHAHGHAHGRAGESRTHDENRHDHAHGHGQGGHGLRRSLLVGVMHGLAGSAALIALAAPGQWLQGAGFVLLFGLGSIAGMVLLSSVIALPLILSGRLMTGLNRGLQLGIGLISITIGTIHGATQMPAMLALL